MLKKITSIQNVGKFKNAGASGDTSFDKHTMIYAPNGYGKTTLCTILRSLSDGDPEHVIGRKTLGSVSAPKIEILMQGGGAVFSNGAWNLSLPDIAVFDGAFISDNVYSGDVVEIGHKRNLYRVIIGRDGVDLARQEEQLATQSRTQSTAVTAARRAVEAHVPDGMALKDFINLPNDPAIDAKIKVAEGEVATAQQADRIKSHRVLYHLPEPTLPEQFFDILLMSLDGIQKDAEERVSFHMAQHNMQDGGQAWVAKGMAYHDDKTCPYCGQGLEEVSLIHAYQALFGIEYEQLKTKVEALSDEIDTALGDRVIGSIHTTIEQNKGAIEFWGTHCDLDPAMLAPPEGYDESLKNLRQAALKLTQIKAGALLEPIAPNDDFTQVQAAFEKMQALVSAFSGVIDKANEQIQAIKAEADSADLMAGQLQLAQHRTIKGRHDPGVNSICATYTLAATAKEQLEKDKATVRAALDKHTEAVIQPYENKINSYLDKFNAGFRIAETTHGYPGGTAASNYQIVINETNVDLGTGNAALGEPCFKNTLSAGDRSTLALAFFLAHLDHDPTLATRIVAFDDPFNSQDRFRRSQTVYEIVNKGSQCAQVIVLSHDAGFLKQVWEKCPRDTRKSLQIVDQRSLGHRIMAFDMDEACKGRAVTEMDDLLAFLSKSAGKGNDIIKKMRVVLETFCKSTYPGSFGAEDMLGGMVGKIRDNGDQHPAWPLMDELDQINEYSRAHHHGENPANDDDSDQIDLDELTGFVKRSLRIANAMPS